jgi:adenylate cyclase
MGLTEGELAARAGATVEQLARLTRLGIIFRSEGEQPFEPGAIQRVRLAEAIERSGIPLEDLATVIGQGHLSLSFLDLLFADPVPFSGRTYQELCRDTGLSPELVALIHQAAGLPPPQMGDPVREDDAAMFPMAQLVMSIGLSEANIARVLRVYGDNLRRIADAEAQFYHTYVEEPMLSSGMSEAQMRDLATQMSAQLLPITNQLIFWLYHRHQEHGIIEHLVEHIEAALDAAGVAPPRQADPPAMCFLDLTGYTALTEERGDEAAAELASSLAGLVQEASQRYGGRPVKWLGDGVMFHFRQPGPAVLSALEMVERTPHAGLPPAHVGLSAGPVVFRDGDYFGRTVNIAARLAARAGPGQVLVSEEVVRLAGRHALGFEALGPAELKGLSQPVELYRAHRAPAAGET